jgi:hypothetical protein
MRRDFLQPDVNPLVLYPFRFRDPVSGRWQRARYVTALDEIMARYAEWELCGPPENRHRGAASFSPWK